MNYFENVRNVSTYFEIFRNLSSKNRNVSQYVEIFRNSSDYEIKRNSVCFCLFFFLDFSETFKTFLFSQIFRNILKYFEMFRNMLKYSVEKSGEEVILRQSSETRQILRRYVLDTHQRLPLKKKHICEKKS